MKASGWDTEPQDSVMSEISSKFSLTDFFGNFKISTKVWSKVLGQTPWVKEGAGDGTSELQVSIFLKQTDCDSNQTYGKKKGLLLPLWTLCNKPTTITFHLTMSGSTENFIVAALLNEERRRRNKGSGGRLCFSSADWGCSARPIIKTSP